MKLKPILYYIALVLVLIHLSSCTDIIEPSISKSKINPEAPSNNYSSASYTINFWWDEIDNALSYHLQVVTPNFTSPGSLILDTIVRQNKFSFDLPPGIYQWRVMAENGSSQTSYSIPRNFIINNSSIVQQSVQLSSPGNNTLTNQSSIILNWGILYGATSYQLEIDTNSFADTTKLVINNTSALQEYTFTFPKDQAYQWRVRAKNDTAQSRWSSVYEITYDHTPPGQVTLSAPDSNQTVALPVTLQWNSVTSAVNYKLYIFKSDSTTTYNSSFPMLLNTVNYLFNQGNSGDKIYWKVSAIDAAGNEGNASKMRSFILQ